MQSIGLAQRENLGDGGRRSGYGELARCYRLFCRGVSLAPVFFLVALVKVTLSCT